MAAIPSDRPIDRGEPRGALWPAHGPDVARDFPCLEGLPG